MHDVVAHLVDVALTTRLGFAIDMAQARFDFDRQNANGLERARGATPQQTLERLRDVATRTSTPPAPLDTRIVEEVIHGEDIRRVVGLRRDYPDEAPSGIAAAAGSACLRRSAAPRNSSPASG